jgi:hypothetical protein
MSHIHISRQYSGKAYMSEDDEKDNFPQVVPEPKPRIVPLPGEEK